MRRAFPDYSVVVRDFVVGVRGSVPEDRWGFHLTALGVGRGDQRRILTLATQGSVEGSWQVLKAWRAESAGNAGTSAKTGRGRVRGSGSQTPQKREKQTPSEKGPAWVPPEGVTVPRVRVRRSVLVRPGEG